MRLWTIHPRYLDTKGLIALWREALLAQKVLQGKTKGYLHHPQLIRFQAHSRPEAAVATYLSVVLEEAEHRGYHFDGSKILKTRSRVKIIETDGQILYEWRHLKRKLQRRDYQQYQTLLSIKNPEPHPLFRIIAGTYRDWEKVK
jgi:hypothetical protein